MLNRSSRCSTNINLLCMLIFQTIVNCEGLHADISLNVLGTGFHRLDAIRNLVYQIDFDNFVDGCYAAVHLQLPSALYVDVNELSNIRRLGISTACSSGETDVELFSEKAKAQNVTVCSPLSHSKCTLKFPIHQRYQYANENGEYVNITLPKSTLLLGCKEKIKEHRISKLDLCSPCVELVAKWREIPYSMLSEKNRTATHLSSFSSFYFLRFFTSCSEWAPVSAPFFGYFTNSNDSTNLENFISRLNSPRILRLKSPPYNNHRKIHDMEDIWTAPVGDTTMLPLVTYVTLLITVLCTIFLARTICKSVPIQHPKRE